MKLIVGLGNPGEKYKNNRHNVGFRVVDGLAIQLYSNAAIRLGWKEGKKFSSLVFEPMTRCVLVKPQTFMNNSGEAVKKLVTRYLVTGNSKGKTSREPTSYESLYIIHDDLDISLGQYKIQKGKGPKLHYGVESIEQALGTPDFWRVRVGVDNRDPSNRTSGEQYVLQDFTKKEQMIIADVVKRIITDFNGRLL